MKRLSFLLLFLLGTIVLLYAFSKTEAFDNTRPFLLVGEINGTNVENLPSIKDYKALLHDNVSYILNQEGINEDYQIESREVQHHQDNYWLKTGISLTNGKKINIFTKLSMEGSRLFLTQQAVGCVGSCWVCEISSPDYQPICICRVPGGGNPPVCNLYD